MRIIGPTCTSKGPRAQDAFTETKEGLTAHRPPDAPHASPETTEAEPRRIPPLVARGDRAIGAEKSRYQQHVESYNPRSALLRPGLVDLGLSDEITNPEVKSAANGLADSAQSLLDATKAADDQPTAAQRSKILTATSQYLESMNKLDSVCTGK